MEQQQNSAGASIFVTRKIKHNTFQYYAWKVAYVASLVVEHAWICWNLAKKLFHFLIAGTRVWVFMVLRLFAFILVLMPGWAALLRYYFFDSFIIRNIDFGKGPRFRNLLDVYLPQPNNPGNSKRKHKKYKRARNPDSTSSSSHSHRRAAAAGKAPVIVFVSGGAWIIGYKLWSGLMARELSRAGYVVIVPDYRNFPQGNIKDMIADVRAALLWTTLNCSMFGGDPEQIILAGQSAGAHISLCALVELYEESLARKFMRRSPFTTLNLAHRTVHLKRVVGRVGILQPAEQQQQQQQEEEEGEEEEDNLVDCIWRDTMSVVTTRGSDKGNESDNGLDDGSVEDEGTDEEEATVNTEDASALPNMTATFSSSTASSFDDRTASSLLASLRCPTVLFPTDSSDFMEYKLPDSYDHGKGISREEQHGARESDDEDTQQRQRQSSIDTTDDDDHMLHISDIKMFVGISGPYNMVGLMHHLHARGLDVSILHYIFAFDVEKYSPTMRLAKLLGKKLTNTLSTQCLSMEESSLSVYKYLFGGNDRAEGKGKEGETDAKKRPEDDDFFDDDSDKLNGSVTSIEKYVVDQLFSKSEQNESGEEKEVVSSAGLSSREPTSSLASPSSSLPSVPLLKDFPSVALFHGSEDKSIPSLVSDELEALLLSGGVSVTSKVYSDMSHTDPILENVLEGNITLVRDMINVIEDNMDNSNKAIVESVILNNSDGNSNGGDQKNEVVAPNSERCDIYLHNNQTVSWPISKGMMRFARMMNPF